jgi:hypothetical protein
MKTALSILLAVSVSLTQQTTAPVSNLPGVATLPGPPDSSYVQLRTPKMSGETMAVTGLTIRRDAGVFVFNRGDFYFTEPVRGKVTSAVFIGEGEFQLEPPTAVEKHNLELFIKDQKLIEPFTELVVHFTDGFYEEVTRGAAPATGAPNARALSILENRMTLLSKGKDFTSPNIAIFLLNYNLPARLLADVHDSSHAGFFNVFIKGKKFADLMFRVDPRGVPLLEPEEVVLANFSDNDLGIWNAFHLKSHYDAGLSAAADEDHRLMDIQHQEISAT